MCAPGQLNGPLTIRETLSADPFFHDHYEGGRDIIYSGHVVATQFVLNPVLQWGCKPAPSPLNWTLNGWVWGRFKRLQRHGFGSRVLGLVFDSVAESN